VGNSGVAGGRRRRAAGEMPRALTFDGVVGATGRETPVVLDMLNHNVVEQNQPRMLTKTDCVCWGSIYSIEGPM